MAGADEAAGPGLRAQFYRFLDPKGAVIPTANARAVGRLTPAEEAQLALARAPDKLQLGYLVRTGGDVSEVMAMPIFSSETAEVIAALVLGFKHADRLHAAPSFARWLAAAGEELLVDTDLVIPVPLHWTRLAWRRYNQSAILARLVARAAGLPFLADMLVRRRRTPSQGELGRTARQQNVSGAFALARRHRARVAGKRILLVDDVLTTGATLEACARTLLRAGAQQVDALTLARVVRRTTE